MVTVVQVLGSDSANLTIAGTSNEIVITSGPTLTIALPIPVSGLTSVSATTIQTEQQVYAGGPTGATTEAPK